MFVLFLFLYFLIWCIVQTPFLMLSVYWLCPKSISLPGAFRLVLLSQSLSLFVYFLLGWAAELNFLNLPAVFMRYGWMAVLFAVSGACYGTIPWSDEIGRVGLVRGFKIVAVQFVLFIVLVVLPLVFLSTMMSDK